MKTFFLLKKLLIKLILIVTNKLDFIITLKKLGSFIQKDNFKQKQTGDLFFYLKITLVFLNSMLKNKEANRCTCQHTQLSFLNTMSL